MTEDELIIKFKRNIPDSLLKEEKAPFIVIAFIGLTGVGKTTLAYLLSKHLKLPVFSHDQARTFMEKHGFSSSDRDLVERLNYERIIYCVTHKISHIIDGDILSYYQDVKTLIESYNGTLYLINVVCPENIVHERLEAREKDINRQIKCKFCSKAGWDFYLKRRKLHLQAEYPENFFFTVDSSKDIQNQIKRLVFKIKRHNYILHT